MILRSFHGLRFEALSPARYLFRLAESGPAFELAFDGVVWTISLLGEVSDRCFATRDAATIWLYEQIILAELNQKTLFPYAHLGESNERNN